MLLPAGATKAVRMRRPSSVRTTGMFCRLGSLEARRPVTTTGLGVVEYGPAGGPDSLDARQFVGVGAFQLGQAAVFQQQFGQGVVERQSESTSSSVEGVPKGLFFTGRPFAFEEDFAELLGRARLKAGLASS